MKTVVVVGAGPAGLTAAYELTSFGKEYRVLVLEASEIIGGISRTEIFGDKRMDIGGHRFFTKVPEIEYLWRNLMAVQGKASNPALEPPQFEQYPGNADPETEDNVLLLRRRVSRIFFQNQLFDYPIRINVETLKKLGFRTAVRCGFSYFYSRLFPLKEDSLENFYINRFGRKLYSMFFRDYTEKLWGVSPKELDPSWGEQRVKGLSITKVLINATRLNKKSQEKETSLIEQFWYPKFGPGQLFGLMAERIQSAGGEIRKSCRCVGVQTDGHFVTGVTVLNEKTNKEETIPCDFFISSMPICDLISTMQDVPADVVTVAKALPYRDFITVGILLRQLELKNDTSFFTHRDNPADCWVYIQDSTVRMGRLQIFNNWSPYLTGKDSDCVWIGVEFFCSENDDFWQMTDEEIAEMALSELEKTGIAKKENALECHTVRQKKAYPAYFGAYEDFPIVKAFLKDIKNLYCVGRNGQHRYNNMDHSMLTGLLAAQAILDGKSGCDLWKINTESSYHEEK